MTKSITAFIAMLMIFPIANADGKIFKESGINEAIIVPASEKRFSNDFDNDTIKQDTLSIEDEKLVGELIESSARKISTGVVSWYGDKFHGRKTASGEKYDKHELTAAHKSLPFGTKVKVTNIRNGKSVVVEINDRGPYAKSRVLDLSQAAFSEIGHTNTGVMKVEYEIIKSED
ncbi:septal ring lytic transglycosylase RlpA family protein [Empedobacter sp. 225-1]|uniref:septal ring lytic transglycosylase RlpA family protein n=1 Tax=unclassified Empedobacter TaxID=2643773 RepID=UPI00257694E8|nr:MULTISPECIES: septal ring lytic transglycosylase RlpA family protein [unclassified Empedobacter]MDM1522669.1 septal ring lytic transglycosylase RlpA family protein [Empedobacter sp. 225-1]MDM1543741.1 septal ring lytic transglycosylase RlpA family protein [Empedobacter sp. 189-2]